MVAAIWAFALLGAAEAAGSSSDHQKCADLKGLYKEKGCCGNPDKFIDMQVVPRPYHQMLAGENICAGAKVPLADISCLSDKISEQAGANVTKGFQGKLETKAEPIMSSYMDAGLCPVNVHWHLGAEHLSEGEYDADGTYPKGRRLSESLRSSYHRRLAGDVRYGGKCYHYDDSDSRYTTEYDWKHCVDMHVGDTYEVHWPHSKAGACGTPNQFQTPFYDGVFCRFGNETIDPTKVNLLADLPGRVGVQAQVFTIINDENYYYPDLMRGMIIDGHHGADMAHYTGSTTGTSRDADTTCSAYTPITWQVDRKCHLISASSFDKMCADMKQQRDDMSDDLHAHGAREVVDPKYVANNFASAGAPSSSR